MGIRYPVLLVSLAVVLLPALAAAVPAGAASMATPTASTTATATPTATPVETTPTDEPGEDNESALASVSPAVQLLDYSYHPENDTFRAVLYLEVPTTITLVDALGPFAEDGVSDLQTAETTNTVSLPTGRAVVTISAESMNGKVGVKILDGNDGISVTTSSGSSFGLGPYTARDVQLAAATAFAVSSGIGVWRIIQAYYGPNRLTERIA